MSMEYRLPPVIVDSADRNKPAFVLNGARQALIRDLENHRQGSGNKIKLQLYHRTSAETAEETKQFRVDEDRTSPSQE